MTLILDIAAVITAGICTATAADIYFSQGGAVDNSVHAIIPLVKVELQANEDAKALGWKPIYLQNDFNVQVGNNSWSLAGLLKMVEAGI
jgi:hypothetical protein